MSYGLVTARTGGMITMKTNKILSKLDRSDLFATW
jgi:hypothetical protein